MQEAILTNVIHFRTDRDLGIIADHGSDPGCKFTTDKKNNKKLTDTLQKADDYFQYILEEEEAEEEEEIPEIRSVERKHEKSTKKPKMQCFYRTF